MLTTRSGMLSDWYMIISCIFKVAAFYFVLLYYIIYCDYPVSYICSRQQFIRSLTLSQFCKIGGPKQYLPSILS